jgi:hypothetical protein
MDREGGGAQGSSPEQESEGDPLREIAEYAAQLREFAAFFARAEVDTVRLAVREARWRFTRRAATVAVAVALVVTAMVYVLNGAAGGLAVVLGGRLWLGSLVTGSAVLLVFGAVVWMGLRSARRAAYQKRVEEYEAIKDRQKARFGHDVEELARVEQGGKLPAGAGSPGAGGPKAGADGHAARRVNAH